MTNLLTAKQESFCQAIAYGLNQSDAYRSAYDAGNMKPATLWDAASKLAAYPEVAHRVAELRNQITAGKAWSFEKGMEEIETNIRLSRFLGQTAAARSSAKDALELSGLLDPQAPDQPVKIARVTVVLDHGRREDPEDDTPALEAGYRVLDTVDEEKAI